MEFEVIGKFTIAVITAIGSIAITNLNLNQSRKVRDELLAALDEAIESGKAHTACELFKMVHGIKIGYKDT